MAAGNPGFPEAGIASILGHHVHLVDGRSALKIDSAGETSYGVRAGPAHLQAVEAK